MIDEIKQSHLIRKFLSLEKDPFNDFKINYKNDKNAKDQYDGIHTEINKSK